ncbi:MAG: hypothetical protein WBW16_00805 [Bacteroidota bacterium]
MPLAAAVLLMILLIGIGKNCKELGYKQYLVIILITFAQVCILVFFMYTIEKPLLY